MLMLSQAAPHVCRCTMAHTLPPWRLRHGLGPMPAPCLPHTLCTPCSAAASPCPHLPTPTALPTPSALVLVACSGKFPPIPAHYSDELKALVEALIKREPESRPDMQQILELEYVRRHMKAYSQHIARNITKRQLSFERSLTQFNLRVGWVHASKGLVDAAVEASASQHLWDPPAFSLNTGTVAQNVPNVSRRSIAYQHPRYL